MWSINLLANVLLQNDFSYWINNSIIEEGFSRWNMGFSFSCNNVRYILCATHMARAGLASEHWFMGEICREQMYVHVSYLLG